MSKKPPTEKASFVIVNDGVSASFKCEGSVIAGIVEAFTWLPPERRAVLLSRLTNKQAELLEREATRAAAEAAAA